jgi:hypothetical protein
VTIGDHHHWHSASYVTDWIEGSISFDEQRRPLLRQAAGSLPFTTDATVRVLDLGGGMESSVGKSWSRSCRRE